MPYFWPVFFAQTVDTSFKPEITGDAEVDVFAIQSDGKIIVNGDYIKAYGQAVSDLIRINPDGSLDQTFVSDLGSDKNIKDIRVQDDGKIIVSGSFNDPVIANVGALYRLNSDGSTDNTFTPNLSTIDLNVHQVRILESGKVLAGGDPGLELLNADGTADPNFSIPTIAGGGILAMEMQSDGKIVAGGNFQTINGESRKNIARFNSDGTLDDTFMVGDGTNSVIYDLAIQSDGKIVIVGFFTEYDGTETIHAARLNTDGSLDNTFNWSSFTSHSASEVEIHPNGKILISGFFWKR